MDVFADTDEAVSGKDRLRGCLDRIVSHKHALKIYLAGKCRDLFGALKKYCRRVVPSLAPRAPLDALAGTWWLRGGMNCAPTAQSARRTSPGSARAGTGGFVRAKRLDSPM